MNKKHLLIGAAITLPLTFVLGAGAGALGILTDDEIKKFKAQSEAKKIGPKVERNRSPISRMKVNKKFDDIVDKY